MTGSVYLKIREKLGLYDEERLSIFRNKVPQGSIRIPFNLDEKEDLFHGKSAHIFHLAILEKKLVPQTTIKEYFQNEFKASVEMYLSYGNNFEYFLLFQQAERALDFSKTFTQGSRVLNVGEH